MGISVQGIFLRQESFTNAIDENCPKESFEMALCCFNHMLLMFPVLMKY